MGCSSNGNAWRNCEEDGTVVNVTVGEDEDDPVLYITDLLIHLAGQQMAKNASEVVEGEKLDILIGAATEGSSR